MKPYQYNLLMAFLLIFSSCGGDDPFTKKMTAQAMTAQLYGTTTKTLTISHTEDSHISWLGFIQSNDYSYFKITKVQAGSQVIISEGMADTAGNVYTPSSNSIIKDITVPKSTATTNTFVNGSISLAGSSDLKITVEYAPLIAINSESEPHEAFLAINYDSPQPGSARIELRGFTNGIKNDKCTSDPASMELFEYTITDSEFDLYFCSKQVASKGQNNTPQDSSDPLYHGASTNLATVPLTDPVIRFYKADSETVCIESKPTPSIPDFTLPIPDGLAIISSMEIGLVEGSYAECSLDSDNNIFCDANIMIDALVSLAGFTLTNQTLSAEDLTTDDCPDFGAISGSGAFGDDSMHLILTGRTLSDQNTEEYNIVDSLIVADIPLDKTN